MKKKFECILLLVCIGFLFLMGTGCERIGIQPPIAITFRQSMIDTTKVLHVTNKSGKETLVMKIDVQNKEKNQEASHVFKVKPDDTYEIGRLEMNWGFINGETYIISADGYPLPVTGTVP